MDIYRFTISKIIRLSPAMTHHSSLLQWIDTQQSPLQTSTWVSLQLGNWGRDTQRMSLRYSDWRSTYPLPRRLTCHLKSTLNPIYKFMERRWAQFTSFVIGWLKHMLKKPDVLWKLAKTTSSTVDSKKGLAIIWINAISHIQQYLIFMC